MPTTRREILIGMASAAALSPALAAPSPVMKAIPSTGERLPAIGMGSWLTFDVGGDSAAIAQRTEVLRKFFAMGGAVIDSSPMYGSSQEVIGAGLTKLGRPGELFAADKVWTPGGEAGPAQIDRTRRRWSVDRFDLLQVHNLVNWRQHLETLLAMKAAGKLRYAGVTSYAGLRYDEIAEIMASEPIDFVQITYNILDREAEARILPLALEKKIAVIANRPFREGGLFPVVRGKALPSIAAGIGAKSWAQFMLKFIVSHPALTAAIPATRRADHMEENMGALASPLPDPDQRAEMVRALSEL